MRDSGQKDFIKNLKRSVDRYKQTLEVKRSHVGNAYDFVFITS